MRYHKLKDAIDIKPVFCLGKPGKKASMELSINAIVILVLAITMLGLGLAFTKKMFAKFGEKLTIPEPEVPATRDEPIVLPVGGTIEFKAAKGVEFTVNFYNDDIGADFTPFLVCSRDETNDAIDNPLPTDVGIHASQRVPSSSYKGFKFILDETTTSPDQKEICTIEFYKNKDILDAELTIDYPSIYNFNNPAGDNAVPLEEPIIPVGTKQVILDPK